MSDVDTLLVSCRKLGAELIPTPEGKLKIKAPEPLPEPIMEALRQRKAEVLAALKRQPPWSCPRCSGQVRLNSPLISILPTYFWACVACDVWGATREGAPFPTVWIGVESVQ